jgi:hypothetical protein
VRKGGILDNIYKGVDGGNRIALLKYAFRLISVGGDCTSLENFLATNLIAYNY